MLENFDASKENKRKTANCNNFYNSSSLFPSWGSYFSWSRVPYWNFRTRIVWQTFWVWFQSLIWILVFEWSMKYPFDLRMCQYDNYVQRRFLLYFTTKLKDQASDLIADEICDNFHVWRLSSPPFFSPCLLFSLIPRLRFFQRKSRFFSWRS